MNQSTVEQILDYLQQYRPKMITFLESLVRAESPSHLPESQKEVMSLLTKGFDSIKYYSLYMPGRKTGGYLFARPLERKKGQGNQLLVGHCDTVWSVGTLREMPVRIANGQMKGPGVYDMKAGLTQILFALQTLRDLHLETSVTPVILINSDEEIGSRESTLAIKRLAKISERAFILEPPLGLEGKLKTARKGLGRFTLTIKGKAAHAGLDPGKGVSAIVELSHQIQQLFALNDPEKGITVNVGMIEGGISPNVVAPESRAVIDVRVLTQEDAQMITEKIYHLKAVHPDVSLQIEGRIGRPPMEKTARNQKLWKNALQNARFLGLELEEATAGGGSDGNTTSLYTATLDGLGTTGDGAHAAHEFIFTEKLIERTALLTLLLIGATHWPEGYLIQYALLNFLAKQGLRGTLLINYYGLLKFQIHIYLSDPNLGFAERRFSNQIFGT